MNERPTEERRAKTTKKKLKNKIEQQQVSPRATLPPFPPSLSPFSPRPPTKNNCAKKNISQYFSFASILWSAAIAWTLNAATHMGGGASGGGGGVGGGGGDVRRFHAVIWSISAVLVALPWAGGVLVGSSLPGVRLIAYARTIELYPSINTSLKIVIVITERIRFSYFHRRKITCGGKVFTNIQP